jgi:hypothetical protein
MIDDYEPELLTNIAIAKEYMNNNQFANCKTIFSEISILVQKITDCDVNKLLSREIEDVAYDAFVPDLKALHDYLFLNVTKDQTSDSENKTRGMLRNDIQSNRKSNRKYGGGIVLQSHYHMTVLQSHHMPVYTSLTDDDIDVGCLADDGRCQFTDVYMLDWKKSPTEEK